MAAEAPTTQPNHSDDRAAPVRQAAPKDHLLKGALLMIGAMLVLPVMDGFAKELSTKYPVLQVVWARYLFHLLAMLPLLLIRYRPRQLVPKRARLQLLRGTLLLTATALFFAGLAQMPQATVLALFFISPLVVTLLAPPLLGERVGVWSIVAVVVGFLGVLLVLRPGSGTVGWSALLALGAGVVHALYMIFTRRLAGSAPPLVTLAYTAVVGAVVMTVVVLFVWVTPTLADFGVMVLLGILAATGHFLLIKAFDYAPATFLAPLGYAEMITAVLVGYIAYRDLPDALSWLGIAIIVGAGVLVSVREQKPVSAMRPGA